MKRLVGALLVAAAAVSSLAEAAIITFNNRAAWELAAGPTTNIDFATWDDGTPITAPSANTFFGTLTLRDVTFHDVRSYHNQFIFVGAGDWLRADLPGGAFSVGADIWPSPDPAGTYSIELRTEGITSTFTYPAALIPEEEDFFGVISTAPIEYIRFNLDASNLLMDNFAFGPPTHNVPEPGVAALLLLGLAGVAATRRRVK
jgi:hypothetical protein